MNLTYHPSSSRGSADFGWLKTNYSFSFAYYYNPNRMGFGALRVLNDDWIDGGGGFPPHSHANMEILTIPFTGALSHKDSSGGEGTVVAGQVQLMSAGTGIMHSEYNASDTEPVTLFQIWIEPNQQNVAPRYEERDFAFSDIRDDYLTFITPDGRNNTLKIYQNAFFSWLHLSSGNSLEYTVHDTDNGIFAIVIDGTCTLSDQTMHCRDAIEIRNRPAKFGVSATTETRLLLVEVPVTS